MIILFRLTRSIPEEDCPVPFATEQSSKAQAHALRYRLWLRSVGTNPLLFISPLNYEACEPIVCQRTLVYLVEYIYFTCGRVKKYRRKERSDRSYNQNQARISPLYRDAEEYRWAKTPLSRSFHKQDRSRAPTRQARQRDNEPDAPFHCLEHSPVSLVKKFVAHIVFRNSKNIGRRRCVKRTGALTSDFHSTD